MAHREVLSGEKKCLIGKNPSGCERGWRSEIRIHESGDGRRAFEVCSFSKKVPCGVCGIVAGQYLNGGCGGHVGTLVKRCEKGGINCGTNSGTNYDTNSVIKGGVNGSIGLCA